MQDIKQLSIALAHAAEHQNQHAVLVAGQALTIWGAYYLAGKRSPADLAPLNSRDIDFYEGNPSNVRAYINRYQAILEGNQIRLTDVRYASLDDNTFQTAILALEVPWEKDPLVVDFLDSINGLSQKELKGGADEISLYGKNFWVLNPVLCLKSRISNLINLYPRLGKNQARIEEEQQRVALMIEIVRLHLQDLISEEGTYRLGLNRLKVIIDIAKSRLGRQLLSRHQLKILEAVPQEGLPARFYQFVLKDAKNCLKK